MIRVLPAEDQAMMRGTLAVLLGLEDDLEIVAQVDDRAEIVPQALASNPRPGYLQRAMEAGARGFLVKDGPADGLADAIRKVLAGRR